MSLVNRMLRDLEDRQAFVGLQHDGVIGDLRSAQDYAYMSVRKRVRLTYVLTMVLICAIAIFALTRFRASGPVDMPGAATGRAAPVKGTVHKSRETPLPARVEPTLSPTAPTPDTVNTSDIADTAALALKLDAEPIQANALQSPSPDPDPNPRPALLQLSQESSAAGGSVDMRFDAPPQYSIYILKDPVRLLVVLPDAQISPEPFKGFKPEGLISGVRYSRDSGGSKLIFDMNSAIVMDSADVKPVSGGTYDFHITYESSAAQAQDEPQASKVTPAPPPPPAAAETAAGGVEEAGTSMPGEVKSQSSEDERARRLYDEGLKDFHNRDYARASIELQQVLQISPSYLKARQLLVSMLLDQGDMTNGTRFLEDGLRYHPDDPTLIKMDARLLLQEDQLQQALQLLARINPKLQDDPDYYALMAAVLQKGRDFTRSGEIYQQLVQFNPGNGVWWAGLGISLDGVGHASEALQAFRKAANDQSIPEGLRAYVSTRIKVLAKSPA